MEAQETPESILLEQIYQATAEELSGVMDTNNMYIALYHRDTRKLEFPLVYEDGQAMSPEERREYGLDRPLDQRPGLTDWVIHNKQPLLIERDFVAEATSRGIQVFEDMGTQCWLGAPMLLRGEVIGVIGLQSFDEEGVFDQGHQDLLMTIASQAAVAIENARLIAGERQKADDRLRRLSQQQAVSDRMAEVVFNPDIVLELVVRAANEVTQSDLSSVYRYDENTASFTGGVRLERLGNVENVPEQDLPASDDYVTKVAESQEPIFESEAEPTGFTRRHGIKAFAGFPLTVANPRGMYNTVGVLFVNFRQSHPFSDEEREILRYLANQAAFAIAYTEARSSAFANEQLAALGTATATLQHRLGNTLSITLPAVVRLRMRTGNDPVTEEILNTIERNTQFANEVIQRMQTPLRSEPFVPANINSLLREAIQECVNNADRFSLVQLASNLPGTSTSRKDNRDDPPEIFLDADLSEPLPVTFSSIGRLQEVFRVLVENAIKAIYPKPGLVTVRSALRAGGRREVIEVTVTDTGKGIDDEVRSRLFRQPVPRREFGEGAGLGLWLSNIIVRGHQGDIGLRSTEPGEGSTFFVRLPVLPHPPAVPQQIGDSL
jgi:signal transduction histidine kinase